MEAKDRTRGWSAAFSQEHSFMMLIFGGAFLRQISALLLLLVWKLRAPQIKEGDAILVLSLRDSWDRLQQQSCKPRADKAGTEDGGMEEK